MNLSNQKILITGGGSGIGLGLTQAFLELGNTVIICGRRLEVLEEVQKLLPSVFIKTCDLSQEADRIALHKWIHHEHPDLTVLINNAGVQQWISPSDPDFYPRGLSEIKINIEAPLHLTSLFMQLPALQTIINVTSGLSFVPLIKVPVYSATKAFFHSLTLSLRPLLKERNIEVIEMIPPALNTDLGGKGLHDYAPPVSDFIHSVFEQLKEGKQTLTFGMSEAVSKAAPDDLHQTFQRMNQLPE